MNILVRGAGFANKGAEAMLSTLKVELNKRLGNVNLYNWVHDKYILVAQASGFRPISKPRTRLGMFVRLAPALLMSPFILKTAIYSPVAAIQLHWLRKMDAVIDISGYNYGDAWGPHLAGITQGFTHFCKRKNIPYIFLPQAWGPFDDSRLAKHVVRLCEEASLVYVRDEVSLFNLQRILNKSSVDLKLGYDIAFLFQPDPPSIGVEILNSNGIELSKRSVVGIFPNIRVYERCEGEKGNNLYIASLVSIIRHCLKAFGTQVVIMPHEIIKSDNNKKDDRYICQIIKDIFSDEEDVKVIVDFDSAKQIKSVIGHMDLVIGSRFHSVVAALSSAVPPVVIGWSHKYFELMKSFNLEQFILSYQTVEEDNLLNMLTNAWHERSNNRICIEDELSKIQSKVEAMFNEVAAKIQAEQVVNE